MVTEVKVRTVTFGPDETLSPGLAAAGRPRSARPGGIRPLSLDGELAAADRERLRILRRPNSVAPHLPEIRPAIRRQSSVPDGIWREEGEQLTGILKTATSQQPSSGNPAAPAPLRPAIRRQSSVPSGIGCENGEPLKSALKTAGSLPSHGAEPRPHGLKHKRPEGAPRSSLDPEGGRGPLKAHKSETFGNKSETFGRPVSFGGYEEARRNSLHKSHRRTIDGEENVDVAAKKNAARAQSWKGATVDSGFKTPFLINRRVKDSVKCLISDIDVPKSDQEWRQRLDAQQYRVMRGHRMEVPQPGLHRAFLAHTPESGIFRCRACSNFLLDIRDVRHVPCTHLQFNDAIPGALAKAGPKMRGGKGDLVCSLCLSFIGRDTLHGIQINLASVYFVHLDRNEVRAVLKASKSRLRALSKARGTAGTESAKHKWKHQHLRS